MGLPPSRAGLLGSRYGTLPLPVIRMGGYGVPWQVLARERGASANLIFPRPLVITYLSKYLCT